MPSEISGSESVYEFAASVIVSEAASFSLKASEDFARACALVSAGMNEPQLELLVLGGVVFVAEPPQQRQYHACFEYAPHAFSTPCIFNRSPAESMARK